jgi:hypothetical protein
MPRWATDYHRASFTDADVQRLLMVVHEKIEETIVADEDAPILNTGQSGSTSAPRSRRCAAITSAAPALPSFTNWIERSIRVGRVPACSRSSGSS